MYEIFSFSLLTVYGVTLVTVSGKRCLETDTSNKFCEYGCCGENKSYTPCCESDNKNRSSMPSFSIFFYALIIFIFFLLVVCCIGKLARLKNRQNNGLQRSNISCNERHSSQREMIQTIQSMLRESRNGSSNTDGNGIDNMNFHGSNIIISPPPYDEAIKLDPTLLPPAYEEIDSNNPSTTVVDHTSR